MGRIGTGRRAGSGPALADTGRRGGRRRARSEL